VNYKHLLYFMQVAESGSIVAASGELHLSPQTISGQIQLLEKRFGAPLFVKTGRRLTLTATGRLALEYARDIFALGAELEAAVRDKAPKHRALEFRVGVADSIPKAVAFHLLQPALAVAQPVRLVCREWRLDRLLAELALHRLDLVIADAPLEASFGVKAYSHRLGTSGITFFGSPCLRKRFPDKFPQSLDGAPVLLPGEDSRSRQKLRTWLADRGIHPLVLGEFDDGALALEFGRRGIGFFTGLTALAPEIERQYSVQSLGAAEGVAEDFFAISMERRTSHPCVAAVAGAAATSVFGSDPPRARAASAARHRREAASLDQAQP
jgi:LysR family transcriptional regulator, transcriptional activator of nhaA